MRLSKIFLTISVLVLVAVAPVPSMAVPISVLVGDDDGYGAGVPDNGALPFIAPVVDNRSAAEAAAVNGAQITDLYSAIFPGYGPNAAIESVIFPFAGTLNSATLTVDMGDFQTSTFGPINVYYNGVLQPGLFNFDDGYQHSAVRPFVLDAAAIANANAASQFVLTLDHANSGDFLAFDYFRLNGDVSVPEPSTLLLLGSGLAGLGLWGRKKFKANS